MNSASSPSLRRSIYALLIAVAAAMAGGRILGTARLYEPFLFRNPDDPGDRRADWPGKRPKPMATLGANDRSRWVTVRALVEEGTYAIGYRDPASATADNPYGDHGFVTEEGWETIDKVLRPDNMRFYSSKPPFLPTLVAGEYWLLKSVLGWSILREQVYVVKTILFTANWLPFVAYLLILARVVERLGTSDWARVFVFAAGCFGTFLTPFLITFNNHTVATCSTMFALYSMLRLWQRPTWNEAGIVDGRARSAADPTRRSYSGLVLDGFGAGFFAGFAACTELPAATLALGFFVLLLLRGPRESLVYFLCGLAAPVVVFCVTNYLAIGQLMPAYNERAGPWYQYEGSYWNPATSPRQGIDWAAENKPLYTFNLLFGHHGLFALTPVFLLSIAGVWIALRPRVNESEYKPLATWTDLGALACLTCAVSVVVVGFYIVSTNNYGGWTSGPRWLMWLTPLLLVMLMPAADAMATRKAGRVVCYALLAISVASVSYPAWNPWRHPWLYDFLESRGAIRY